MFRTVQNSYTTFLCKACPYLWCEDEEEDNGKEKKKEEEEKKIPLLVGFFSHHKTLQVPLFAASMYICGTTVRWIGWLHSIYKDENL